MALEFVVSSSLLIEGEVPWVDHEDCGGDLGGRWGERLHFFKVRFWVYWIFSIKFQIKWQGKECFFHNEK